MQRHLDGGIPRSSSNCGFPPRTLDHIEMPFSRKRPREGRGVVSSSLTTWYFRFSQGEHPPGGIRKRCRRLRKSQYLVWTKMGTLSEAARGMHFPRPKESCIAINGTID